MRGEARGITLGEARGTQQTLTVIKDLQQNRSPEWIAAERGIALESVVYIAGEMQSA